MNFAEYKRAAELFSGLGIDMKSDSELARGYFILRLINSLSVESGGNCSVVRGEKFRRILAHYQVAFFVPFQSVREETLRQIDSLCTLLQQNDLFTDRSFFVEFSPWIIADWDGYTNLFMEEKFGGKQLIILLKQLEWHEEYVQGQADFSFDPAAFYQTHSDIIAYWETNFKSSEKLFCNSWNAVFCCKCTTIPVKTSGTIANAIEQYRHWMVPMNQLLVTTAMLKNIEVTSKLLSIRGWCAIKRDTLRSKME